ncbi:hypothetical protein C1Y63_05365 [Corynebacterium sp. 13CS0277]|nr:hypothetical protein C1Y63_05365 [Corynebacterium sp. 13CS0277]
MRWWLALCVQVTAEKLGTSVRVEKRHIAEDRFKPPAGTIVVQGESRLAQRGVAGDAVHVPSPLFELCQGRAGG